MYESDYSGIMAFVAAYSIVFLIIAIIEIIALWKLFKMANKPGWAAIIPIYNLYIMLEIAGLPWWWLLVIIFGGLIPFIGFLIVLGAGFYIILKFVQSYGKDVGFAIGVFFLGFIFLPILAFSKSTKYVGPAGQPEVDKLIEQAQQTSAPQQEQTTDQPQQESQSDQTDQPQQ